MHMQVMYVRYYELITKNNKIHYINNMNYNM